MHAPPMPAQAAQAAGSATSHDSELSVEAVRSQYDMAWPLYVQEALQAHACVVVCALRGAVAGELGVGGRPMHLGAYARATGSGAEPHQHAAGCLLLC